MAAHFNNLYGQPGIHDFYREVILLTHSGTDLPMRRHKNMNTGMARGVSKVNAFLFHNFSNVLSITVGHKIDQDERSKV